MSSDSGRQKYINQRRIQSINNNQELLAKIIDDLRCYKYLIENYSDKTIKMDIQTEIKIKRIKGFSTKTFEEVNNTEIDLDDLIKAKEYNIRSIQSINFYIRCLTKELVIC